MVEKEERSNMNKHCVQSHKKVPSVTNQGEKKKTKKPVSWNPPRVLKESSVSLSNSQI